MDEIQVYESKPLTANDIKAQVDLIQDVMHKVMRKDEHYGVIPGCGDKPALLKPGAEKLNLTFRMAPDPETEIVDLGGGHREYRVKVILRAIETGRILGAGVGSASTMETKWRYRNAEPEITAKFVPKEYWDIKKNDPAKALEMIGGKGFATKKVEGNWYIAKLTGEKVEHGNPADFYNTCWKMGKKRSLVDAVLTVTAASDIFTQDIEEMVENGVIQPEKGKDPIQQPQEKKPDPPPSSETATVVTGIDKVGVTEGKKKDGKPFTKYSIHVGELSLSTFSKTIADDAKRAAQGTLDAKIVYKTTQYGLEVVTLEIIEPPPGAEEQNA